MPRYDKDGRAIITAEKNGILIFKEKHITRYFSADEPYKIEAAALKILTERLKDGTINKPEKEPYFYNREESKSALALTDEQIAAIPSEALRKSAERMRYDARRAVQSHEDEVKRYERMQTAIKMKDGRLAYTLLEERRDYEYEEFEFDTLE